MADIRGEACGMGQCTLPATVQVMIGNRSGYWCQGCADMLSRTVELLRNDNDRRRKVRALVDSGQVSEPIAAATRIVLDHLASNGGDQ